MNIKNLSGFIKIIIIIDAVSTVIVLLYWFIKGPHNLVHLVDCFSIGGFFLMIPGAFIYVGPKLFPGRSLTRFNLPLKNDESDAKMQEYIEGQLFYRRIGTMLLIAGILLILIGLLIYAIG